MNEQQKRLAQVTSGRDMFQQIAEFWRGVIMELRRVTWPTRDEWVSATVLTVGLVVGIGLFVFIVDQLFGWLFSLIHPVTGGG